MSGFLRYLRQQAALPPEQRDPDPPESTAEDRAAYHADLARRIQADIDAPRVQRPADDGVIRFPACMLDAAGLVEIDG